MPKGCRKSSIWLLPDSTTAIFFFILFYFIPRSNYQGATQMPDLEYFLARDVDQR